MLSKMFLSILKKLCLLSNIKFIDTFDNSFFFLEFIHKLEKSQTAEKKKEKKKNKF